MGAPPFTCSAHWKGNKYYDTDINAYKYCDGTAWTAGTALDATDLLDLSGVDSSTATEGLLLPQIGSACAGATAEGQICWDSVGDTLYVGDAVGGPTAINSGGGTHPIAAGDYVSGSIVEDDLNVDEVPVDNDILTFDSTGSNFSWQTPAELSLQPLDSDLTTVAGLTATTGNVMFAAGSAWTSDPTPAIVGTDFTGIPSSAITTEVRSMYWGAGSLSSDGTNCAAPAEVTINSGPKLYTVICTDNDASLFYGSTVMPDSWTAADTPTFEVSYIQTAADTAVLNLDVQAQCRGATEVPSSTWGTKVAIDDAAVTGSNAIDMTTSAAVTPAGTCAGGDSLFWSIEVDATGTTTAAATLHFVGVKMEYSSDIGDE